MIYKSSPSLTSVKRIILVETAENSGKITKLSNNKPLRIRRLEMNPVD